MSKDFNELASEGAKNHKSSKFEDAIKNSASIEDLEKNLGKEFAMGIVKSIPTKIKVIILLVIGTSIYGAIDLVIKLINYFL